MEPVPLRKVNSVLLLFVLSTMVLFYGRDVLIPVTFSILLAMLMVPVSNWLERKGMNRVWSSTVSILIIIIAFFLLVFLVGLEIKTVSEDWDRISKKFDSAIVGTSDWIEQNFGVASHKQLQLLKEQSQSGVSQIGSFLKVFFSRTLSFFASSVLCIVFMYLMLYQREKYKQFFLYVYKGENPDQAIKVLEKISKVAQNYLIGRALSIIILTILFFIGLALIGIKGAFLLAFIGAVLTIVPYVGTIIGGLIPVLITLVTESSYEPALYVLIVMAGVQAIDNYFIEPYVVGGEVNLSALSTILILAVGGYVWGVSGMILFIPMLGILKIVFDNIDELKPYGYLIGDQKKERSSKRIFEWFKKKFGRGEK